MNDRKHVEGSAPDDLASAPFADGEERAEFDWLCRRESDASAPPPTQEIANQYGQVEELLADMAPVSSDEAWQDEVLRIATTSPTSSSTLPRRRRAPFRWAVGGALGAAAAALAVWFALPSPAVLEVAIRHGDMTRSDPGETVVGDVLIVKATPHEPGDLRVYRSDGALVGRCPDGPACIPRADGQYLIEITLDSPVRYQVLLVLGQRRAQLAGTMEDYIDTARAANARIIQYEPIDVH